MNKKLILGIIACVAVVIIAFLGCPPPPPENTLSAIFPNEKEKASTSIPKMEIYFDASKSMKAYFTSDNDGKMSGQLSQLHQYADSINLFFLRKGQVPSPYSGRIADLVNNTNEFNGADTQFEILLPMLCNKARTGKVCVLVTDGIVYINKNTSRGLVEYENLLSKAIKDAGGDKFAYALLKYSSNFNTKNGGDYYNMQDTPIKLTDANRPYYLIAVGTPSDIRFLKDKILKNENDKPELSLIYGIHDKETHIASSNVIPKVNPDTDIVLQASLPTCLNQWYEHYGKDYFKGENVKIDLITEAKKETKLQEGKDYTIELSKGEKVNMDIKLLNNIGREAGKIKITIENNIPQQWLDISLDNDTVNDAILGKTFGLKYLVNGVRMATGEDVNPLAILNFEYTY